MSETPITFELKVNPKNHTRPPADAEEELVWSILDTAQAVVAQGAAMVIAAALREEVEKLNPGGQPLDDQEIFLQGLASGGPASYADLAADSPDGNLHLAAAFSLFLNQTRGDADFAFQYLRGE